MKRKFNVEQGFAEAVEELLSHYRLKSTREKLRSWIWSKCWEQGRSPITGSKKCLGLPCVEVSRAEIWKLTGSCLDGWKKFTSLLTKYMIVKKDSSWVAPNFSSKERKTHPNRWHFNTFPACRHSKTVTLEYDPEERHTNTGAAIEALLKADGKQVQGAPHVVFQGKWAVDDWKAGSLTDEDLGELGKTARMVIANSSKTRLFRTFDALTGCKKEFVHRAFVDVRTGKGLEETFDQTAGQISDGVIAAGFVFGLFRSLKDNGYSILNTIDDTWLIDWAENLHRGNEVKFYERLWKAAQTLTPYTKLWGGTKFTPSTKKAVKDAMMMVCNPKGGWLNADRLAFENYARKGHPKTKFLKARIWLYHMALKKVCPQAWAAVQVCRMNPNKDSWYALYTYGERAVMAVAKKVCEEMDLPAIRKHDAVYTPNPDMGEEVKRRTGLEILKMCGAADGSPLAVCKARMVENKSRLRKGLLKLFQGAGIDLQECVGLRERLELTPEQKVLLKHAMSHKDDYLAGWMCRFPVEATDWML